MGFRSVQEVTGKDAVSDKPAMNHHQEEMPIACSLTSTELREREATLIARFRSAVMATEELADGYAFRMPGNSECIALITELMAAERECCPFLRFELNAEPNRGPLTLRVTGPAGAKNFVRTVFFNTGRPA